MACGFLARNEVRLFLTSLAILFVELMLIRWIPANVKYIGFFSNFLLMASFLGIGLGILLGRRGCEPAARPVRVPARGVVALIYQQPAQHPGRLADEIFFGLAESRAADINFLVLPLIVVASSSALMATLALPLGPLLKCMPPLRAYAIDIGGSHGRHRRCSPPCPRSGRATRSSGSRSPPSCARARARPRYLDRGRSSRRRRWPSSSWASFDHAAAPPGRDLVAVLPDQHVHRPAG